MSESLRNDGRIWVPKDVDETRPANEISEEDRDYYLERLYPAFGNLVPRDVASRVAKRMVDSGKGVGPLHNGVYLDFKDAISREGKQVIEERYGNLFEMYQRITDEDPYQVPMRIYPAPHYTMGGLWVDYNLMTNVPGFYAIGEANFSDHGANRLGASALMQGLADGYFVLPATIGDYLTQWLNVSPVPTDDPAFTEIEGQVADRVDRFLSSSGSRSVDWFHRQLGKIMLDQVWDVPQRGESAEGALRYSRPPRRVPQRCPGARVQRIPEPESGARRAGGRLLRTGASDVSRRPAPGGVVWRALPRGIPDRGGRGPPRR